MIVSTGNKKTPHAFEMSAAFEAALMKEYTRLVKIGNHEKIFAFWAKWIKSESLSAFYQGKAIGETNKG
jgi:hypothetical protein